MGISELSPTVGLGVIRRLAGGGEKKLTRIKT
jgi:hypothetical protein